MSALLDGADFAKGTRFAKGGGSEDITHLRALGNRILTGIVNLLYGTKYTDLCYGFNVFWQSHCSVLGIDATALVSADRCGCSWGDGFEIETLINIRIAAAGLGVAEVPVSSAPGSMAPETCAHSVMGCVCSVPSVYERFIAPRQRRTFRPTAPDRHERRPEPSPSPSRSGGLGLLRPPGRGRAAQHSQAAQVRGRGGQACAISSGPKVHLMIRHAKSGGGHDWRGRPDSGEAGFAGAARLGGGDGVDSG